MADQLELQLASLASLDGPLLTPAEAATLLAVRRSWIYDAARTGQLPCIRVGRHAASCVRTSGAGSRASAHDGRSSPARLHRRRRRDVAPLPPGRDPPRALDRGIPGAGPFGANSPGAPTSTRRSTSSTISGAGSRGSAVVYACS